MTELNFVRHEPIDKGWSGDKKYCAVTAEGMRYLLRITSGEKGRNRPQMFTMMRELDALGVPMCRPVACGTCEDGVYTVMTWIDGKDAEEVIPGLPGERQYAYGWEAGRILKIIHTLPAPSDVPDWEVRFSAKMDRKIAAYRRCPLSFDGGEEIIAYLENNRGLLAGRPQCFQHGDYHIGNMMMENGKLVIIDFDRYDFGDPWEEFNRIVWCAQAAPRFASGLIDGYFDGQVPMDFWRLLALYIGSNMLSSLPWAIPFGEGEVQTMLRQAQDVMGWYDGMKKIIPGFYHSEPH